MGTTSARTVPTTARMSSPVETTGAPAPAVVTFTAGRAVALTACTPPAMTTPATSSTTGSTVPCCEEETASRPPAAGRTTVWTTSLTWSTAGTLSATTSTRSSTAMSPMTHQEPMPSNGARRCTQPKCWASATASSGMYAFSPAGAASVSPERTSMTPPAYSFAAATSPDIMSTVNACASARSVPVANVTSQTPMVHARVRGLGRLARTTRRPSRSSAGSRTGSRTPAPWPPPPRPRPRSSRGRCSW